MSNISSLSCDIVLLPVDTLAQKAIILSKQLAQQGTLFALKEDVCFPHISLYMTQLKVSDLGKAESILANIAANTSQFNLTATRYDQAEGYIDADYTRIDALDRLQMSAVEAINPIRDGMREKDKVRMLTATGKARENLEEFGYRGVGELFRPHVTLARFISAQAVDTSTLPDPSEFSGRFVKLGLCEMGDNGTCIRKIAEFHLNR